MNATFILEHIKRASYNLIRFLCWDETLNDVWELCICSSVHHNLRFRLRYRISPWKINYVIYRVGMIFVVYLVNFGPLLVTLPQSTSRLLESEFLDMFLQSLIYLLWMSKWTNYFHPVLIARLKQNQVGFLSVTYLSGTKRIEVFLKSMSCITRSHVVDGRRILLLTWEYVHCAMQLKNVLWFSFLKM